MTRAGASALEGGAFDQWETITFRGDGGTGDATITLSDSEGRRVQLKVFGVTGEVHLEGPPP